VPYRDVRRETWAIEDAWMILEYPTLLGGSAFIRVHVDGPTLGLIRDAVARVRSSKTEGIPPTVTYRT
jgi:hypothetical protein